MLKKAGIIVATAAAGLLAVTPFAMADTTVNKDNLSTKCDFTGSGTATSGASNSGLVNGITGVVSVAANAIAQAPVLSCNNVNIEDVLDFDSNNTNSTVTETKVKDSFNQ